MYVALGNAHPIEMIDGEMTYVPGPQQTVCDLTPMDTEAKLLATLDGIVEHHMAPGTKPTSVFCSDPMIADVIKSYYSLSAVGGTILNLRTNSGNDFVCGVQGSPSSSGTGSYAPAYYLALSPDSTAPSAADTSLASEITSGTLSRVAASYSHTSGTNSYSLTNVFTSDQTVTINKAGIFQVSTPGNGSMLWEELFSAGRSLGSGDQLSVTVTIVT